MDDHPPPASRTLEQQLAPLRRAPWIIVAVLLVATSWLTWRAYFHEEEGDVITSAMIAFERQNSLTVFSSRFEVVAESTNTPSVGPFDVDLLASRQAMLVPATVEYRIDLSDMTRDSFRWSADEQVLDVTIPTLRISRPNLDEARARIFTEGVFVSRTASTALSRSNSQVAERNAVAFARNPEILALARTAARDAIRQNLAIPLQVAGYGDVTVNVRFDGETSE
ncbi:DUF4230 domain-containing protein [Altererythrobacter sp. KTW20L]|uniref:DUF4230 domain-containing protein n=1 Tax=Altererythrobacter sp. KTW20L TaxID=2942210 RepID=UPI0020C07AD4|nr:DUF4230 domain-containing protein [Altererythrobacter sp. KTW20L]MCL6250885.1 DUF4230 domain-containing protein [Altererythrobacter sp. KTW20L]